MVILKLTFVEIAICPCELPITMLNIFEPGSFIG
jgi:hypothetical protein